MASRRWVRLGMVALRCLVLFSFAGELVVEGLAADTPRIKVQVSRKKDRELDGTDYDNAERIVGFKAKLRNGSMDPVKDLEIEFLIIGKCFSTEYSNREDVFVILAKESVKVDLEGNERKEVDLGTFASRYDRTDIRFGADYEGYALIMRTPDGKPFLYETDRRSMVRDPEDYAKLLNYKPERQTFDDDIEPSEFRPSGIQVRRAD